MPQRRRAAALRQADALAQYPVTALSRPAEGFVDEEAGLGGGGGEGGGEDVGFAETGEEDLGVGVAVVVVDDVEGAVSNEMREEEKSRGRG